MMRSGYIAVNIVLPSINPYFCITMVRILAIIFFATLFDKRIISSGLNSFIGSACIVCCTAGTLTCSFFVLFYTEKYAGHILDTLYIYF